jgi:hypothetical protein
LVENTFLNRLCSRERAGFSSDLPLTKRSVKNYWIMKLSIWQNVISCQCIALLNVKEHW